MSERKYKVAIQLNGDSFGYVMSADSAKDPQTYVTEALDRAVHLRNIMQTRADSSRDYLARKGYPPGPIYKYSVESTYE